jgi:uncharacterized membrane protein YtjA (UPF0391 family)
MSLWKARRQDVVISRLISVLILGCMAAAVVAFGGFSAVTAGIAKVLFFLIVFSVAALAVLLAVRRRTVAYRR